MGAPKVLVVEENAHRREGHYPHWFAGLADEFVRKGLSVTVLTSRGWACDGEFGSVRLEADVQSYHPIAAWIDHKAENLETKAGGRSLRLLHAFRSALTVLETRRAATRLGAPQDVAVIVLSTRMNCLLAVLLAPLRGRWACYRYQGTLVDAPETTAIRRTVAALARRRAQVRSGHGGHVRIAANNSQVAASWRRQYPWMTVEVVPAAEARPVAALPKREARLALGLAPNIPIALFLGVIHHQKSPDCVWAAFTSLNSPGLLLAAGQGVSASLDQFLSAHPDADRGLVRVFDGHLDDEEIHRLLSAADYLVASFKPTVVSDSGTVALAASIGLAVCCSEPGPPSKVVSRYDLGTLFRSEDESSLIAAVSAVLDHRPNAALLSGFFDAFSPERLAASMLAVAYDAEDEARAQDPSFVDP